VKAKPATYATPLHVIEPTTGARATLRPAELVQMSGLSETTIRRLLNTPVSRGGIPCVRVGTRGGAIFVRVEDWQKWLRSRPLDN
jgi:hypothetical protein